MQKFVVKGNVRGETIAHVIKAASEQEAREKYQNAYPKMPGLIMQSRKMEQ